MQKKKTKQNKKMRKYTIQGIRVNLAEEEENRESESESESEQAK